ncbi:kinase-like domain-containing protein [Lineolata rhizophorae]|uniref:Kinase-like domain-containing protein n=1 Tax=Lineolata rhizophorae TaxID=578093 RepID=A0A6A6NWD6_9PEZI|nr:kinase-like domain-containing protein [Lineolata rhizophorae]
MMPVPSQGSLDSSQEPRDARSGIQNSWFRRSFTLAAFALLRRWSPTDGRVFMLTPHLCLKCGPTRHISEAETMVYVANNTSVPVPKVYCAFRRKGITYILMERIEGNTIGSIWASASAQKKDRLRSQLRAFLQELRSLPPPRPGHIGDVNYSKLYDDRLSATGFGPFTTTKDFHRFLRRDVVITPGKLAELDQLISDHESREYETCFTHGDLNSYNILVRDGCVVGIIDWEMAGWYPKYWEYTSAWHVNPFALWWKQEVGNFLDTYPAELEMEKLRRKLFPMF